MNKKQVELENKKINKAISLFSGAGGDTLGMENAGVEVVGFVEFDKKAIETHKSNFPKCELIKENITQIEEKDLNN